MHGRLSRAQSRLRDRLIAAESSCLRRFPSALALLRAEPDDILPETTRLAAVALFVARYRLVSIHWPREFFPRCLPRN